MKTFGSVVVLALLISLAFVALPTLQSSVNATSTPVTLGTAASFAVLAYSGITNTGVTTITGDVGSAPTDTCTGFAGFVTVTGTNYCGTSPPLLTTAHTDLSAAIVQADGYAPTTIPTALDTQNLVAGVYSSTAGTFALSSGGVLTLNGAGVTTGVWIFQAPAAIAGALSTTGGSVVLENGADSCNVFWVTSSGGATLGTGTTFVGTIMAYSSVTLATGTSLQGAALASTGDVTLQSNTISTNCVTAPITTPSTTTTTSTSTTSTPTTTTTTTATPTCNSGLYSGYYTNSTTSQIVYFYDLPHSVALNLVDNNGPAGIWESCVPPPTTTTTTTSAQSCVYLSVVTQLSNGTTVNAFTDIWNNQSQPVTTCIPVNTVETVGVFDSGCYAFSHWLDTGSALRFRPFSISSNTTFTAIYHDTCVSTPSTDSVITVNTILNGSGAPVVGLYSTLWVGNVLNQSCFSPCSFMVGNGQSYTVAVADFGGYSFSHWTDTSTDRFHTVVVGNTTSTISLTAVYVGTSMPAAAAGPLSQELAIQVLPQSMVRSGTPVALVEFGAVLAVVATFALVTLAALAIRRPRKQQRFR